MSEPTGPAKPRSTKGSPKASQDPSAGDSQAADSQTTEPQPTSAIPSATQPLPAVSEAAPAGPPAGTPAGPPAGTPGGPPPVGPPGGPFGPATGGPGGPPPKGPGLWRQATSTTGGLIAVVVAGALAALLVLGVVATVGLVAVRAAHHDGNDRMEQVREDGRQGLPPGQQKKLDRLPKGPQGPEVPRRQGDGLGDGQDNGMGGMGGLLRGAMGLGNVQHGEFTVDQDGKAVVMTVQRGTVIKSSATSVTVKSDDAFTASYVIGTDTRTRNGAPAVGDSVLVVAEKTGAKAVIIAATRKG